MAETLIDRRAFLGAFGLLAASRIGEAQTGGKVGRIGLLTTEQPQRELIDAFRHELHRLGYADISRPCERSAR
jgi:hypothetical protein